MEEPDLKSLKIGFIGGGNMATAIGAGLIQKGILDPRNIWVSARTAESLVPWKKLGANITLSNREVVDECEIVFLAVKPQLLHEATSGISGTTRSNRLFVSVLAGITIEALQQTLEQVTSKPRIIRSMPNTPMMVGEGITVYSSENATERDLEIVHSLLSYTGVAEKVSESLINAISGLSGSGPAYAYLIIEGLADGAVKMGVPRAMATKFAAQVLVGAGQMVLQTGKCPGQLKDEVCSPGGTTITGIHALECGQVRASMMNAVQAAVTKSNEISAQSNARKRDV